MKIYRLKWRSPTSRWIVCSATRYKSIRAHRTLKGYVIQSVEIPEEAWKDEAA